LDRCIQWDSGWRPSYFKGQDGYEFYWDYSTMPPEKSSYIPHSDAPKDCWQLYEDVTEGTPVSPVFDTREELCEWIKDPKNGFSDWAIKALVQYGSCCSAIVT